MSGPKVIDHQAVERQRTEVARRRWLALRGRADALSRQCVQAGHPQSAARIAQPAGSSSIMVDAACNELERAVVEAVGELDRRQFADRTREVASALLEVLANLERREQQSVLAEAISAPRDNTWSRLRPHQTTPRRSHGRWRRSSHRCRADVRTTRRVAVPMINRPPLRPGYRRGSLAELDREGTLGDRDRQVIDALAGIRGIQEYSSSAFTEPFRSSCGVHH